MWVRLPHTILLKLCFMERHLIELRRLEYLLTRLEPYLKDPAIRATALVKGKPVCKYRTEDGRKCFIGQDIPDDVYDTCIEGSPISYSLVLKNLSPEIQGLGQGFLTCLLYTSPSPRDRQKS